MDDSLNEIPPGAPEPQPETAPAAGEAVSREEALEAELAEAKDRYLRTLAEVENFKKRLARERVEERAFAAQEVATAMLPIVDNLERTIAAAQTASAEASGSAQLLKGVELVAKQMEEALRKQGVHAVDAPLGLPFDPNLHQPLMQDVVEGAEEGAVLEVLQKGYRMGDRLLRPAMVRVATRP